ncbi:unnamed protein product [Mytilus edulis]|uniref:Uncharacterized protein n=1 Tax=Mytilus edulis TaxID=6550 RepID=A0A8S3V3H6_MYTED|nr:unnamed protein product [Mytilus edulis]
MSSNSMEDVYLDLQPSPRLCHVSSQAARIAAGMKINYYIDLQPSLRLCHERNNAKAGQSKFQSRWQMSSNSMEDVYLDLQPSPRLCHVSSQAARIAAGMKINYYIDLQPSLRLCHERNNVIKQCQCFHEGDMNRVLELLLKWTFEVSITACLCRLMLEMAI